MAETPRRKGRRSEKEIFQSPGYARSVIQSLARRAEGGNPEAVDNLRGWLAKWPGMRSLIPSLDELAVKAERAWVARLCGSDELAQSAAAEEVAALKAQLLSPTPTPAERLLAGAVVVAHLAHAHAALAAAQPIDRPEVKTARERILALAQRRLADALKAWEAVRTRKAKGLRPGGMVKLFDPAV